MIELKVMILFCSAEFSAVLIALLLPVTCFAQAGAAPAGGSGAPANPIGATLKSQCTGEQKTDNPELCGHERLLREGNNVYVVYRETAQAKVGIFSAAMGSTDASKAAAFATGLTDGTCVPADRTNSTTGDAGAAELCLQRLRRLEADARIKTRQEIVRNNDGRRAVLDEKTDRVFGNLGPGGAGAGAGTGTGSDTVMRDFVNVVTQGATAPNTLNRTDQALQLLRAPTQVSFTPTTEKAGDALKNTRSLQKVEVKNTDQENLGLSGDDTVKTLNVTKLDASGASGADASLVLPGAGIAQKVAADQRDMAAGASGASGSSAAGFGIQALQTAIDGLRRAPGASGASAASGGLTFQQLSTKDLNDNITGSSGQSGSDALLRSSLQNAQ